MNYDNLLNIWNKASTNEVLDGLSWYTAAHDNCEAISYHYGLPLHTVTAMVSALSPRNKWSRNLRDCENTIKYRNKASVGTFNINKNKAVLILDNPQNSHQSNLAVLSGLKTQAFCDNITFPNQSQLITIDNHAYNAYKGESGLIHCIGKKDYYLASLAYQILATKLDIKPLQFQAVIWLAYRRINGIK